MKMIFTLTLLLIFTGCDSKISCEYTWLRSYNDKVVIIDGFYKGSRGLVKKRDTIFVDVNSCNRESYTVELEDGKKVQVRADYVYQESKYGHVYCEKNKFRVTMCKIKNGPKPVPTPKLPPRHVPVPMTPRDDRIETCKEKLRQEYLKCGYDQRCKLSVLNRLRRCIYPMEKITI